MVVFVFKHRQNLVGIAVDLVTVERQFVDRVLAARVNDDVKRLEPFDTFLDRLGALYRGLDLLEAVLAHVADGLWPSAVCHHRPFLSLGDRHQQRWRVNDLTAHLIGLIVDIQLAADNVTADANSRVRGKAPVSTQPVDRIWWRLEVLDRPVLEHARLAVADVFTLPDVQIFVRVAALVIFHLFAKFGWKPRIVFEVHFDNNALVWHLWPTQQPLDRVMVEPRVPCEPKLRSGLADCRAENVQRELAQALGFLTPGDVISLKGLDAVSRMVLQALKDDDAAMN